MADGLSAVRSNTVRLSEGEIIITSSGIYTFTHHYIHKQTAQEVFFVGTLHMGKPEYYERMKQILEACNLVLAEKLPSSITPSKEEHDAMVRWHALLDDPDLDIAYFTTPFAFSRIFYHAQKLGLIFEGAAHVDHAKNWISANNTTMIDRDFFNKHRALLCSVSEEDKKNLIIYTKTIFEQARNDLFTVNTFVDALILFESHSILNELIVEGYIRPRDIYCIARLDAIFDTYKKNHPQCVGIIFGAEHLILMRKLIEARGFVLQKSTRLRCTSLS